MKARFEFGRYVGPRLYEQISDVMLDEDSGATVADLDAAYDEIRNTLNKFVDLDDGVTIEFDTVKGTAKVIKNKAKVIKIK